jgi:U3 small nucleolar ribonucleoprotein protein LCP5
MTSMEEETKNPVVAGLEETLQKIQSALQPSIESHTTSESFSPKDGLDFLDVKNSLLLSYLIDLTVYIRDKSRGTSNEKNLERLTEMKTVLDKMGGLDKKLRYQIDKLMAASTTASTFAAGGDNNGPEDPLQFRPDPRAFQDGDSDSDDSHAEADEQNGVADDDLAAARATLSMANEKRYQRDKNNDSDDNNDGVYRAPRTTSVPYAHDQDQKQKEKEKRTIRRMRATELAQTLRAQYGEAPEQEDIHGGGDFGRQREAARRATDREAEKTKYEESQMIRLTESRKEKKEKKRLMRMETSNLSAISDLGNLVRETSAFGNHGGDDVDDDDDDVPMPEPGQEMTAGQGNKQRYDNGKRRRDRDEIEPGSSTRKGPKGGKAKNSHQAALYSTESKSSSKKKNTRR